MNAKNTQAQVVRCAIYTRKSTTMGLDDEYNSLQSQEDSCRAYIAAQAANGWIVTDVYSDGGWSGSNMERPEMQRLLGDVEAHKIDTIVVYKVDRLSRSLKDFTNLQSTLLKHDVNYVSVTQNIDTSTATGRMLINILMSFASFEREVTIERIKNKFDNSRKLGMYLGGSAPVGYKVVDKKLVIDELEAVHIRNMFNWYIETKSSKQTAKNLNASGSRSHKGDWNVASVLRAVANVRYAGLCRLADGTLVKGQQEAIVTREVFDAAQAILAEHNTALKNSGRPRSRHNFPLVGKVFCGHCNKLMTKKYSQRKADGTGYYAYYVCGDYCKKAERTCPIGNVQAGLLEGEIEKAIENLLRSSLDFAALISRKMNIQQARIIGALARPGELWQELTPDEHHALLKLVLARATVYENSINLLMDTSDLGPLVNTLSKFGIIHPDRSLEVQLPIVLRTVSGIKRVINGGSQKDGSASISDYSPEAVAGRPLLGSLARGYALVKMLDGGEASSISALARKFNRDDHLIMRDIRTYLTAPSIARSILYGTEPNGLSIAKIADLSSEFWPDQLREFGMSA